MPTCSLCSAWVEELEGIVPGELDLSLALHRITECPGIDMTTQRNFLYSPAKIAELSGGFGASKTVTACVWQILLAQRIPGSEHFAGRLNKPALEMTTRATYLSLSPRVWVEDWVETKGKLVWKNGATTWFKHLDIADADVAGHIRSMNLTSFLVDQAEEISESTFLTLIGRLRRHTEPLAHFGRMVINPAGQDWNWRRFFDPKRPENWKKNAGFSIDTRQNAKNLPEDYIQNMLDNYPEDWQARFIRGEFTEFSDLVYKEFSPSIHCFDSRDWIPPLDWPVIVGLDFGGVDPWGVVFIAVEPKSGSLFVFEEIYQAGVLVREIAERFQEIMKGRTLEGMAYDYENQQAALELGECGVDGSPANKDVKAGIFKVAQYLHISPAAQNHFTGTVPGPRLYVASHCENTIRELGSYKWGKDRKGEVTGKPQDGNDHTCFPAETLIATETGWKEIRKLKIGEKVWTRKGLKPIRDWGTTSVKPLITRFGITATENHPIWTERGFIPLRLLMHTDTLCICAPNVSSSMELHFTYTKISDILAHPKDASSIATSGPRRMDPFRQTMMFITPMTTDWTTGKKTWFASLRESMGKFTGFRTKREKEQQNGMVLPKGKSGTLSTPESKFVERLLPDAGFAVTDFGREVAILDFARPRINLLGAELPGGTVNFAAVSYADRNLAWSASMRQSPADGAAELVYNMTVEGEHEYFANGVLVSNCDALRYAIHTFRPEPASPEIPKSYENSKIDAQSRLYWHRKAINDERVEREKAQLIFKSPFSRRRNIVPLAR